MIPGMAEGVFECCERGRAPWGVGRCLCAWTSGSKPGMEKNRRGELRQAENCKMGRATVSDISRPSIRPVSTFPCVLRLRTFAVLGTDHACESVIQSGTQAQALAKGVLIDGFLTPDTNKIRAIVSHPHEPRLLPRVLAHSSNTPHV